MKLESWSRHLILCNTLDWLKQPTTELWRSANYASFHCLGNVCFENALKWDSLWWTCQVCHLVIIPLYESAFHLLSFFCALFQNQLISSNRSPLKHIKAYLPLKHEAVIIHRTTIEMQYEGHIGLLNVIFMWPCPLCKTPNDIMLSCSMSKKIALPQTLLSMRLLRSTKGNTWPLSAILWRLGSLYKHFLPSWKIGFYDPCVKGNV